MKKILILTSLLILTSCTDPRGAEAYLVAHGYTNIHVGGYAFGLVNKGDISVTSFKAINRTTGKTEEGAVAFNNGFLGFNSRWSIKVDREY